MFVKAADTPITPRRRHWARHAWSLLSALLLAAAWGSVVQTHWNMQALSALGVEIPALLRLQTIGHDLVRFLPVYAGIVAAGWLPALALASWMANHRPAWRNLLMAAGAAAGMAAAVRTVDALAPMPVFIDATRHLPGMLLMALGAAVAGLLHARLTSHR